MQETGFVGFIGRELLWQEFQGHDPVEFGVFSFIEHTSRYAGPSYYILLIIEGIPLSLSFSKIL
jgi:hypothetical protein